MKSVKYKRCDVFNQATASAILINVPKIKMYYVGLKNGKSAGQRNKSPELIKYNTDKLFNELTKLF